MKLLARSIAVAVSFMLAGSVAADEDRRLQDWVSPRLLSGELVGMQSAAVDHDGVSYESFGRLSLKKAQAPTPQSRFQIGSVSKVFTHLLLAELVGQGELSYSTTLGELLPQIEFSDSEVANITMIELATHTSGLPRLPPNLEPMDPDDPYASYDVGQLHAALAAIAGPLEKTYNYSNFGTGLLGHLLGEIDGSGYFASLGKYVLGPLGLSGISGDCEDEAMASGHFAERQVPAWRFDTLAGAGALCASALDMAEMMHAAIVEDGSLASTWRDGTAPLADTATGLKVTSIWHRVDVGGQPVYWHSGATGGYASFVGYSPTLGIARVLLANSQIDLSGIGLSLFAAAQHTSANVNEASLQGYTGTFRLSPSFSLVITEDGGSLFVQASGQPRLSLTRNGADLFTLVEVEAALQFLRNHEGEVDRVVLLQNGIEQTAARETRENLSSKQARGD